MTACRWRECFHKSQNGNRCASAMDSYRGCIPRDGNLRKAAIKGHIVSASRPTDVPSRGSAPRTAAAGAGAAQARQHHRPEKTEQEGKNLVPELRHRMRKAPRQGPDDTIEKPYACEQAEHSRPHRTTPRIVPTLVATLGPLGYDPCCVHSWFVSGLPKDIMKIERADQPAVTAPARRRIASDF